MSQQSTSRIVVGLDHSAYDETVLAVALIEAARRGAMLHVVHAADLTMVDIMAVARNGSRARSDRAEHVTSVRSDLCSRVAAIAAGLGVSVPVEYEVGHGDPATCLLGAAREADLIVTGTRSNGAGSPLLLGTVSQDVAVHASCPVLLVPHKP